MSDEPGHPDHDEEDHHHDHHHGHVHAPASFGRAFAVGIALNAGFVVLEAAYGWFAHSLALLADAGHNLGDVFGLALAWAATFWAGRPPTPHHTYGWRRSSILAALGNATFLFISVGVIGWEAVQRLGHPATVDSRTMIWVAAVGIVVNTATALMFMAGRKGDLNVRAAFLHMAADALLSAGVVVTGIVIGFTGWGWLDPAVSLVLVAVITMGTWGLLRDSLNLALDGVPAGIDMPGVRAYLGSRPGVVDVHHLHVWGLSTCDVALTAHLVLTSGPVDHDLLESINHDLDHRFGIGHATIQFEAAGQPGCPRPECHPLKTG